MPGKRFQPQAGISHIAHRGGTGHEQHTRGFRDGKEHFLKLRAVVTADGMILRLRDDGRSFNLIERCKMIYPDDPARNIGLRIIFAAADEAAVIRP